MTVGYNTILKLRRVENMAQSLGFSFGHSKAGYSSAFGDVIALQPNGECLPVYCRGAEIMSGDLDSVETFLKGILWAKNYYEMLGLITDDGIGIAEQQIRQQHLVDKLKNTKSEIIE